MPTVEFSSKLIRTLKGAPLSCLLLLKLAGQPVTAEYLERNSGYSDKTINSAMLLLEDYGYITRNGRYAWQIADGVGQLPLMNLIDEPDEPSPAETQIIEDNSDSISGTRRNSDSENFRVPSSSRSLTLDLKPLENQEPLLDPCDPENFRVSENLAACDAAGIQEPKRSKLSQSQQVHPELIRYHVQSALNIAMAIYRIEHGWKIKAGWTDPVNVCARTIPKNQEIELPAEAVQAWEAAKVQLEAQLRRVDFETWVKPARLTGYDAQGYTINIGNEYAAQWIIKNALGKIKELLGGNVQVEWEGKGK